MAGAAEWSFWSAMLEAPDAESYRAAWLNLQCRRVGGVASAILVLGSGDDFRPQAAWPSGAVVTQSLARCVEQCLKTGRAVTMVGEGQRGQDTRHMIAQPLVFDGKLSGAVACELVGVRDDGELQRALHSIQWGAAWVDLGQRKERADEMRAEHGQLLSVLELASSTAEREGFRRSATALATELAVRLGCERVSIGFVDPKAQRVQLAAVSHTAEFEGKSNLARATEAAMDETFDQEVSVSTAITPGAGFQLRVAHEALLELGGAKSACSVPFGRDEKIYGVITLERSAAGPLEQADLNLVDVVGGLVGPLLELERRAGRNLAVLAWEALGNQARRLVTPGSPVFKAGLVLLAVLVLFFAFWRTPYRVTADALLEAKQQRTIVAPFKGYVSEAPCRPGDIVQAGDLLCSLDDRDLKLERGRLLSQNEQYEKRYSLALAERDAAQVNIVRAQINQIGAQLELVEDRLARTRVLAPMDGVVVEGDLSQAFGSPVERGQILFQVAPLDELRLVLYVDERDVEYIERGQSGALVLKSYPSMELVFEVLRVTPVSATMDGANTFRVEAGLAGNLEHLRPGMEGVGKVETAPQLGIWNVTHEALDWMRLTLWEWSP